MGKSNNLDDYAKTRSNRSTHKKVKKEYPAGFRPSVSYSKKTQSGDIVAESKTEDIDWKEQLESYFGKDAHKYKVLENADLLYKKYVTEIVSMPDSTYFTKKEVLKFLADIYNTL